MANTIKVSDEVIKALRIRKANFEDKTFDDTLKNLLGITKHEATILNPAPISLDELNKRNK